MKKPYVRYTNLDGYRVVQEIFDCPINLEATRARIVKEVDLEVYKKMPANAYKQAMQDLFYEKAIYLNPGINTEALTISRAESLQEKLRTLGKHQVLSLDSGQTIQDYRGQEFWTKNEGRWEKSIIARLGEAIPEGSFVYDALPDAGKKEIEKQIEAERIKKLSAEEKKNEHAAALDAALNDADTRERKARITREVFDASAWYKAKKAEIDLKYA
jgi:hypothetical protein